jgi:hypothetical protein
MRVENCFYLRMLPTTKAERVKSMCGNFSLSPTAIEAPHAILALKSLASRKNVEEKLVKCGLFSQVTFLKNFNIEA